MAGFGSHLMRMRLKKHPNEVISIFPVKTHRNYAYRDGTGISPRRNDRAAPSAGENPRPPPGGVIYNLFPHGRVA